NVADYLRQRLFGADTSVIMTSATLAMTAASEPRASAADKSPLLYFARQVGGEKSTFLQAGSPFDYERQMKIFVAGKMPDPRDEQYQDRLIHWIEHFIRKTHGKAFVLFTNFKLMLDVSARMEMFFDE